VWIKGGDENKREKKNKFEKGIKNYQKSGKKRVANQEKKTDIGNVKIMKYRPRDLSAAQ
jgi:hypothetical protein